MSTPTPRTDATWSMSFYPPEFSAAHTARTMRDECATIERELADIRALANRRNKRDHSQDTTHQLVAALDQALDIAQAELATERARIADLVADLNDACITLTSAEEDCDDYAMQNTRFKLTAVREVLLQHIPNAAMKEDKL